MTRAPQVGDRIQVTGTVAMVAPNGCRVQFDGGHINNTLLADEIAAGTLLPRPLKVGDRVWLREDVSRVYRIEVILDDSAAISRFGALWGIAPLSALTLADSEGQK